MPSKVIDEGGVFPGWFLEAEPTADQRPASSTPTLQLGPAQAQAPFPGKKPSWEPLFPGEKDQEAGRA